jgi:hypothetical protein
LDDALHRFPHVTRVTEECGSDWLTRHESGLLVGAAAGIAAERASALVDLLVDEVLDRRSVALAAPHDGIEEPEVLRAGRRVVGTILVPAIM